MDLQQNPIPTGTWWTSEMGHMVLVICVANLAYTKKHPMTVVWQDQNGRYMTERADEWHAKYKRVVNFVPQVVFSQDIQDLTMNTTFRRLYFQMADCVYGLKTRVPKLEYAGCTINLPGATLKVL